MQAESHRQALLLAMGVDVYILREAHHPIDVASYASSLTQAYSLEKQTQDKRLAIVSEPEALRDQSRYQRLCDDLLRALRLTSEQVLWLYVEDNVLQTAPPSEIKAWLVLGQSLTRPLGEKLSTIQQMSSTMAVTAKLKTCFGDTAAKRALWQALKPLLRALHYQAS